MLCYRLSVVIVLCCYLCCSVVMVLFYVLIVCTVTLPPGVNPIAVDKYKIYICILALYVTMSAWVRRLFVGTFLKVRRVLCVVMPLTWHLGQCGNVLRCSLYATMRVNTIVSPSINPPRTWYRSLYQPFVASLWTLSPYHVFLFSALLNEGDSTWVGVSP